MSDRRVVIGVAAALAALAILFGASRSSDFAGVGHDAYTVPGLGAMSVAFAESDPQYLTSALLLQVYTAFGLSDEAEIYDTLAEVADGAALEALYLERMGAMAGGGLDQSDQTIHEMNMTDIELRRSGETLEMNAEWEVIGQVGHDEHTHVRGNSYRAELIIAPAAGAWKITGFELREVDRTNAGEIRDAET